MNIYTAKYSVSNPQWGLKEDIKTVEKDPDVNVKKYFYKTNHVETSKKRGKRK